MKILLLNGGGLDSLCLARILREQQPDVYVQSLFISYGLPSEPKASRAAQLIARRYCNSHDALYLYRKDGDQLSDASLFSRANPGFVHVPHFGLLLIVTAFAYAAANGFEVVMSGIKSEARKPEFFPYFSKVLESAKLTRSEVELETPLFDAPFPLVYHIIRDDPLLQATWSCNELEACGQCVKCKLRQERGIVYDGGIDA